MHLIVMFCRQLSIALGLSVFFGGLTNLQAEESKHTGGILEEIIVTATKRATALQDTSESIQAFSGETLGRIGASDFNSYFRIVPNLDQSDNRGPGNTRYSIRGVVSGGAPLVNVYIDEVPALGSPGQTLDSGGSQPDIKLWDIERIEVLKGPQGTLYGNGSMGGTIRVIANKPDPTKFDMAVKVDFNKIKHGGDGNSQYVMVNVPLIEDQLAVRLTGYKRNIDGYIDEIQYDQNDANDEETTGGRFSLRWTPSDRLTLTATAYTQDTALGAQFELFDELTKERGDSPTAHTLTEAPYDDKIELMDLTVNYSFDWAELTYVASYQKRDVDRYNETSRLLIFDLAGLPPSLCGTDELLDGSCFSLVNSGPFGTVVPATDIASEIGHSRTHELRLASQDDGLFDWTFGLFYQEVDRYRWGQVTVSDVNGKFHFNSDGSAQSRIFSRVNKGDREQYAAFGEVGYEFLPGWRASLGLRWVKEEGEERQNLLQNFGPGPTGLLPVEEFSDNKVVTRYKLSWDLNEDILLYVLASEGFRVGGPNQPVGFAASAPSFDSDSLWNYEFGWKTTWMDGFFVFNGAAFYIDWSDIQFVTTDSTGAFTLIGNGGDAEVVGFETDIKAQAFENLELGLGIGYARSRFSGTQPLQALPENQSADGNRLPGAPVWSTTFYTQYTWSLNGILDGFEGFVGGDWSYRSTKTTGVNRAADNFKKLPSYHQLNLSAGITNDNWDITLSMNNVFDALPEISGRIVLSDPYQYASLQPRTVSISAMFRY